MDHFEPALSDSDQSLLSGLVDNNGGGVKKSFYLNDLSSPSIAGAFNVTTLQCVGLNELSPTDHLITHRDR